MSSIQGDDDLESQPRSDAGVKYDADPSLTMSANDDVEYGSHRDDEGEDMELNVAELSEQEPADSPGRGEKYRDGGPRGSESTGGGYTAGERGSTESFALKLTSMIEGIIQQTQTTMEGLLNNLNDIDGSSLEVIEELQNAKDWGTDRKCKLEEDRDKVHQAVCRVLDVLNITNTMMDMARPQVGPDSDIGDH